MKRIEKQFVALTSVIANGRTVALVLSTGEMLCNECGISSFEAIEFLYNLVHKRKRESGIVFVCFAFNRDNEFIFSGLPFGLRNKLFEATAVKSEIAKLEAENEDVFAILCDERDTESMRYQQADFDFYVNQLVLKDLKSVKYKGYDLKLLNGKKLTIRRGGKSLSVFDIQGFFKGSAFSAVVATWLGVGVSEVLQVGKSNGILTGNGIAEAVALAYLRSLLISALASKLSDALQDAGINLREYTGAGAIAGHWLQKTNAKNAFYNYRYKRQNAPELWKAQHQSYYGGRAEQLKIGTVRNVYVYDINSAYANAIRFLPTMLKRPIMRTTWQPIPFSVWYIDYDLSQHNRYFGALPYRFSGNTTLYRDQGSGYFWQPEILYLIQNYPNCFEVKRGFVYDCAELPFDDFIQSLYDLRTAFSRKRQPLANVLKIALAGIYGKFCQAHGKGRYYNRAYAGFVTSFVRAQMLEATHGNDDAVITFQTDAIHSMQPLPLPVSDKIGEYKQTQHDAVTYLDNGVYRCSDDSGAVVKEKTRGFKSFDFDEALADIQQKRIYAALVDFFIGHNVHAQQLFKSDYLSDVTFTKEVDPLRANGSARRFTYNNEIDLRNGFIDSRLYAKQTERESALYTLAQFSVKDFPVTGLE